jgi:hypothetical protein
MKDNKKKSQKFGENNAPTSPFSYINAINKGEHLINDSPNSVQYEKEYNAFIANKAFSFHYDTVLQSNQMNMNSHLENGMQYEYYMSTIRPRKRMGWYKSSKPTDLDLICEYFAINKNIGLKYLNLLSESEIKIIRNKGVVDNGKGPI